jgi:hypothetical protein
MKFLLFLASVIDDEGKVVENRTITGGGTANHSGAPVFTPGF